MAAGHVGANIEPLIPGSFSASSTLDSHSNPSTSSNSLPSQIGGFTRQNPQLEDLTSRSLSSRALYRSELETSRTLHSESPRTFMPGSGVGSMRLKRLAGSPPLQKQPYIPGTARRETDGNAEAAYAAIATHTPRSWLRKNLQAQSEFEVHQSAWSWLKDARVDIEAIFTPSAEEIKDKE